MSLLLLLLPFTGYIQIMSHQLTLYANLIRNSGLFNTDTERLEASKSLYEGLMHGRPILFSTPSATLTGEEQQHMLDVSQLLIWNRLICVIGVLLFLLYLVAISRKKWWKQLYRVSFISCALLTGILAIGLFQFNGLFYLFHRLLFRNDLWLLPADSVLLAIFPGDFFLRQFIVMVSIAIGWLVLLTVCAYRLSKGADHANT